MEKIGLALGGGGSKGAYQIGAWQAFREMDIEFAAIAGTSIGSINGAFMACGDFEGASGMWQGLKMEQCLAFSENRTANSPDLLSLKNANLIARELLKQHGLNTSPLRELLGEYIHEDKIRQSPIHFGLMTTLYPNLNPLPRWIDEIPAGQLLDYMMASAGFPGLQMVKIDGQRYIDGGVVDNVPISMLKDLGYRRIIAIDLSKNSTIRSPLLDNLQLTYIHNRMDLGGTFDTTAEVLSRNRRLGYLDTMKAFGRLSGEFYAFEPEVYRQLIRRYGPDNCRGFEQAAVAYDIDRSSVYAAGDFLGQIQTCRREAQQSYMSLRQALQIENKFAAIMNGKLKVLNLLPPQRLAFLMEVSAKARHNGSMLQIPMHLFRNLDQAAQALCLLDGENQTDE